MEHETSRMLGILESLLFIAGDEGLTTGQLASATDLSEREVRRALDTYAALSDDNEERGITVKVYGGAYRLVTKAEHADYIKRLIENPAPQGLTQASLEVLAIIAYKQPVTRVEIDDIRGVKSDGPIHTLISKGLIMETGRSEGTGRAILFGTTDLFLDRFGLESINSLPPLDMDEEADQEADTDLFMTKFQEAFNLEEDEGGNGY